MSQCPACASFNEEGAAFCGQCGAGLFAGKRGRRRRWFRPVALLVVLQVILFVGVVWIIVDPAGPKAEVADGEKSLADDDSPSAMTVIDDRVVRKKEGGARVQVAPVEPRGSAELSVDEVARRIEQTLVVVEVANAKGRTIREIRGVLVHPDGVVLTRLSPLLGGYQARCRLQQEGLLRAARRGPESAANLLPPVLGIIRQDAHSDLAILRIEPADEPYPSLPIVDAPPRLAFEPGDPVWVLSGHRPRRSAIDAPEFTTVDQRFGALLAESSGVVPESFLVVESFDVAVVGLCRPLVNNRTVPLGTRVSGSESYRVLVDPVDGFVAHLEARVSMTLEANTRQNFDGTFVDLVTRGRNAHRLGSFSDAIDFFSLALERGALEGIEASKLSRVERLLRESYFAEIERLRRAKRLEEATEVVVAALEAFARDAVLWYHLGALQSEMGLQREALAAFLEVRDIEGGERVEPIIESLFQSLAAAEFQEGHARQAELTFLDGIQQLPRSGILRLDLGSLYHRWGAWEDAIRLLEEAKRLDPSLRGQVDILLDKIDDTLSARDAVVIPIPEGSSAIRAKVRVDERFDVTFLIDTGATQTSISEDLATRLGYNLDRAPTTRVITAAGPLNVKVLKLASVTIEGYGVRNLGVFVLPRQTGSRVNLLGLNFLNFFKFSVDSKRRQFRLERQ